VRRWVDVVDRGKTVVRRGEPDPGLGCLALGPMVAVEAQLGGVEPTEALIDALN